MSKLLDSVGLAEFGKQFLARLNNKYVSKSDSENFTTAEKEKLSGIGSGAEANVLEAVQVNGTPLTITNETVNLAVTSGSAAGTISVNSNDVAVNGFSALANSVSGKADVNSPAFTGTPTSVTPTTGDNSTKIATTAFVKTTVDAAIADAGIPSSSTITALDTRVTAVEAAVGAVAGAYVYKGTCTYANLPSSGQAIGDVYNVSDAHDNVPAGTNYAWNGTTWDALAGSFSIDTMSNTDVTSAITEIFDEE